MSDSAAAGDCLSTAAELVVGVGLYGERVLDVRGATESEITGTDR